MLYSEKELEAKANHLAELFPEIKWPDIIELIPQVMEIIEIRAIVAGEKGSIKLDAVMGILNKTLDKVNSAKEIKEAIPLIIKIINDASKGKFAINKEQVWKS